MSRCAAQIDRCFAIPQAPFVKNTTVACALIRCVKLGDIAGVLRLADEIHASANSMDVSERSALFFAAEGGHSHILWSLLERGAAPNSRCSCDTVPLATAAFQGHVECVQMLLAAGADVSSTGCDGRTAHDMTAVGLVFDSPTTRARKAAARTVIEDYIANPKAWLEKNPGPVAVRTKWWKSEAQEPLISDSRAGTPSSIAGSEAADGPRSNEGSGHASPVDFTESGDSSSAMRDARSESGPEIPSAVDDAQGNESEGSYDSMGELR